MRTSTIAMSGAYERTLTLRSSASPARPTTSCPASWRSELIPSRSSASSSATTIRSWGVASLGMENLGASRTTVDPRDLQQVEHEVARILAETDQPVEVYAATLATI